MFSIHSPVCLTRKSTRTRNSWLRSTSFHILANHYLACYLGVRHFSVNGVYLNIFLSILSAFISFAFIAYGLSIFFGSTTSLLNISFAFITSSYGVTGLYCIYLAVKSNSAKAFTLIKYVSLTYFVIYFVGCLDSWRISGHEFLALFSVSIFLLINWLLLKSISNRCSNA
jgi:hypothetical protein